MRATHGRTWTAVLLGLLGILAGADSADAGISHWTPLGPDGGRVGELAIAPSQPDVVYAEVFPTLYRTGDRGAGWSPAGELSGSPWQLFVDPGDPQTLYARFHPPGAPANGPEPDGRERQILRSADGGGTWVDVGLNLPDPPTSHFITLAVEPRPPAALYAATDRAVWKSLDGGESWAGKLVERIYRLVIDPVTPSAVYAVAHDQRVWGSLDGGATWSVLPWPAITRLWIDPQDSAIFYAIGGEFSNGSLLRSADGGLTWREVHPAVRPELVVSGSGKLYRPVRGGPGVWRSDDGGESWVELSQGLEHTRIEGLALDPSEPEVLYGVSRAGVFRTDDEGEHWSAIERGIANRWVTEVLVDAERPNIAFAAHRTGVHKSTDGGHTWSLASSGFPIEETVNALAQSSQDRGILFAGTASGVYKSDDGGDSWIGPVNPMPPPSSNRVYDLAVDPSDGNHVIAVGSRGRLRAPGSFVQVSTDGGASWSEGSGSFWEFGHRIVELDPWTPSVAYLGSLGLHQSTDGGLTWDPLIEGTFDWGVEIGPIITGFAIDGMEREVLYAATETDVELGVLLGRQLVKSTDGGSTWFVASGDLDDFTVYDLVVSPRASEVVYAATSAGVYRSGDGAATWAPLGDLPVTVYEVTVHPLFPRTLFAATDAGIYQLTESAADGCAPGEALCLGGGRFHVEVAWRDFEGRRGLGQAVPLTDDTGTLWFFGPDNVELLIKVLDGQALNGHFWVFYASLSNVGYTVQVTDVATGRVRAYLNPSGHFASAGDIEAFPALVGHPAIPAQIAGPARGKNGLCTPDPTILCLGDRFEATLSWRDFSGRTGIGMAGGLTADSGTFWFFDSQNVEVAIKVLDGQALNGHHWVFYASLSNVEFTVEVRDRLTGESWTHFNPLGSFASGGDITALP